MTRAFGGMRADGQRRRRSPWHVPPQGFGSCCARCCAQGRPACALAGARRAFRWDGVRRWPLLVCFPSGGGRGEGGGRLQLP
eukprot:1159055-Heterocapsa_arctica.AAC.1